MRCFSRYFWLTAIVGIREIEGGREEEAGREGGREVVSMVRCATNVLANQECCRP